MNNDEAALLLLGSDASQMIYGSITGTQRWMASKQRRDYYELEGKTFFHFTLENPTFKGIRPGLTRSAKEKRTKWPLVKNEILAKKYLRNKKFAGSKLLSNRK